MESLVSAVIPTYNRAEPLERALESVRKQTVPPLEILVVDDGSDDGTGEIVANRFPEVRVLSQPQGGVSSARNRGIAEACGEWIAFLDSDDEWRPEKLEVQMAALARAPGIRLCHADEIWVRKGVRVNPRLRHAKSGGWIFHKCLALCAISPSAAVLHRSVFEDVGLFDENLPVCEDYDYWLRFTATNPVLYVDRPLVVKHGGHPDQLSRSVEALDRYRIQSLEKLLDGAALEAEDRGAAIATLLEKLAIYGAGVRKRGRTEEALELERLAARFAREIPAKAVRL